MSPVVIEPSEITLATHPARCENASIAPLPKFSSIRLQGVQYPVISIITSSPSAMCLPLRSSFGNVSRSVYFFCRQDARRPEIQ